MEKKIANYISICLTVTVILFATACGKRQSKDYNLIVGSWVLESGIVNGARVEIDDNLAASYGYIFTFNEDKTMKMEVVATGIAQNHDYKFNGEKITIKGLEDTMYFTYNSTNIILNISGVDVACYVREQ